MRFKKEQRVEFRENGKKGKVIDVIVKTSEENGQKKCEVLYLVKPDDAKDFDEYLVCTRKDLRSEVKERVEDFPFTVIEESEEGFKVMMYAKVFDGPVVFTDERNSASGRYSSCAYITQLKKEIQVAYTICSRDDAFDFNIGLKIARHRLREAPYFKMYAERDSEFDADTIEAIMRAKAKYIIKNIERFVNKRGEHYNFKK